MKSTRLKHWATLLFPVLVSLYLFRRSFRIWFLADDFAWLGLRLSLFSFGDLMTALFSPMAQGTIRTLSERLFFLSFESLYGLESLPMRLWMFLTLAVAEVLLVLVVQRLSGSLRTGILAAILWALNFGVTVAMSWLSSYNQILLSALVLGAFYCFMRAADQTTGGARRWLAGSWLCFLLGFGALESIVVLPGILLAWAFLFDRRMARKTLPFFIPAIAFVIGHFVLIPKTIDDPAYRMHFDGSLLVSVGIYWQWLLAAVRIQNFGPDWAWLDWPSRWILTPALLGFVAWRTAKRDFLPIFGLLMSLALIAPMLPLRDHRTDYYLASASLGLVIVLAALPLRVGWLALPFLLLYAVPSFIVQGATFEWYLARTGPVRILLRGLQHAVIMHPEKLILLDGLDRDMYWTVLADDALRLVNAQSVRLAPGTAPTGDPMLASPGTARAAFERDAVLVYRLEGVKLRDVTAEWERGKALALTAGLAAEIKTGEATDARQFGEGWFPIEDGNRWMGARAVVSLGGPFAAGTKLRLAGYVPNALGTAELSLKINGEAVGSMALKPGKVDFAAAVPGKFLTETVVAVEILVSKTVHEGQDGRELSLVVATISIR